MNISYLNRKPSKKELKEGQVVIANVDGKTWLYTKNKGQIWRTELEREGARDDYYQFIESIKDWAKVLDLAFESGLEDGKGADLWVDDDGKVTLEIDNIRVRGWMAIKELVRKKIRVDNGTLLITSTAPAKVRRIKQR